MSGRGPAPLLLGALSVCGIPACVGEAPRPAVGIEPAREVVVDNLKSPWSVAFLSERAALITEKEGGLLVVDLATGAKREVAGLPADRVDDVRSRSVADNGGLFDVVLHPDFGQNGFVYLSYAAKGAGGRTTKVVRGVLDDTRLQNIETILVAEPYSDDDFHYGGGLIFGADGKLYVTIGERLYRESDGPPVPIAQDPGDRRGKIYRLNPDGSVPGDNPDFGPGAVPGLFALGIRAAQGMTLHPVSGEIWFSEHGSNRGDEINALAAGANYGWPIKTSGGYRDADYSPPELPGRSYTDPFWSWRETVAPTGLTFYFGDAFPAWQGDLLVSGLSLGNLWRLNFAAGRIVSTEALFLDDRVRSRKVAVSPAGTLYMLTDTLLRPTAAGGLEFTGEPGGQLLRITNAAQ